MTAAKEPREPTKLTRTHRILIGVVVAGAVVIAGIGFAGSYAAVRELAFKKGFGAFSYALPVGIDAGICVLLALDLLLTWIRIPFPLLRQTAWLLTAATIAFNGAAAWPDPLGVGMHAVIPILFVVAVEAARHAIGRIADITVDKHMEGVRLTRWLLSPLPTFLLWRRMKLWELRSYEAVIKLEQERLVYQARLHSRFGRAWRRKAPVESLMPLRLARFGVPLAQTAPSGLAAAGIEPALLPPAPAVPVPELERPAPVATGPQPAPAAPTAEAAGVEALSPWFATPSPSASYEGGYDRAYAEHGQAVAFLAGAAAQSNPFNNTAAHADAWEFEVSPADAHGPTVTNADGLGPDVEAEDAGLPVTDPSVSGSASIGAVTDQAVTDTLPVLGTARAESVPMPAASAAAAPVAGESGTGWTASGGGTSESVTVSSGEEASAWEATVTDTSEATARLPEQQTQESVPDPVQQEILTVVTWLDEADAEGKALSGAAVARRLGVSPKTGQRRVIAAKEHREEQRRQQGRAHLRSVNS
nr:DUF2637 domain-containing protein [Streptomyces sp. San01]